MKKRVFLLLLCLLTVVLSIGLLTACDEETPNVDGTLQGGSTGGGTTDGGNTDGGSPEQGGESGGTTAHTHSIIHHAGVEAQCNKAGNIEYWSCSGCDKFFSDANGVTEITDKTSVTLSNVDCSYTDCVCKWCGDKKHSLTHHSGVEAQCNKAGNIEYWSCSGCTKNFTDSEAGNEALNVVINIVGCVYEGDICKWCEDKKPSEGLIYTISADQTHYTVTGKGECNDTHIIIANKYNGKPVKGIAKLAFYGAEITGVTIPSNVETIGDGAFYDCLSLKNIIFEDNARLMRIEDQAFRGCKTLTSIVLPDGIEYIGSSVFYNTSLRTFTIPSSVKTLGNYVFSGCFKLVEVINKTNLYVRENTHGLNALLVHNGESKIVNKNGYLFIISADKVNYLLGYEGSDTELILPSDYNGENYKIDGAAFSGNHTITSVVIPNKVTAIGSSAFSECDKLVSVNIPNSVETLGDFAFYFCSSLQTVTFEENCRITRIGDDMFRGCTSLVEITLPDSITSIGDEAFFYCSLLERITLPEDITSIGREIFSYCSKLTIVNYLGTEGRWNKITKADRWDYNAGSFTLVCRTPVGCDSLVY